MTPYVWGRAPMEGGWVGGREIDVIQFNFWVERNFCTAVTRFVNRERERVC